MKKVKDRGEMLVYTIFNQYTLEHTTVKAYSEEEAFRLAKRKIKPPLKTAFINKI